MPLPRSPVSNNESQQTKRRLIETSPEKGNMAKKPVGNMDVGELMQMMRTTMNTLLEEKLENLPTKKDLEDVKSEITVVAAEMGALKAENEKLKEEVEMLKNMRREDEANIKWLEHQIKSTKLVFKGVTFDKSATNSIVRVCMENLKVQPNILSARTVAVRNGFYTIIAEFESEKATTEVLKATGKLAGSSISVDKDLHPRRQRNKRAMLAVRREILAQSKKHKITIRDDKMVINNNWFTWSVNNELVCGKQQGETVLKTLYGVDLKMVNYNDIFNRLESKN